MANVYTEVTTILIKIENIHHSKIFLPNALYSQSFPPPALGQPGLFCLRRVFHILEFKINRIAQHIFVRVTHLLCASLVHFFSLLSCIPFFTMPKWFIQSPVDRHLGCFQFGDIMNKSARNLFYVFLSLG